MNQGTGIEAKTTTGADGDYDFSKVKVGRYTVTAEAPGFSKAVAANITWTWAPGSASILRSRWARLPNPLK